jgi:hypothetical protein
MIRIQQAIIPVSDKASLAAYKDARANLAARLLGHLVGDGSVEMYEQESLVSDYRYLVLEYDPKRRDDGGLVSEQKIPGMGKAQ